MYRKLQHSQWADSHTLRAPQLTGSSAGAGRAQLRPRAGGGAAAKRQSRQDKQRKMAQEELQKRAQQALPEAEARKPAGALQWLAQQQPQRTEEELHREADHCVYLESLLWEHYYCCFTMLHLIDGGLGDGERPVLEPVKAEFVADRKLAYEHSIAQFQASPSSSLVPPPSQGLFDCIWKRAGDVARDRPGPAAAQLPETRELLDEVGARMAASLFRTGFRNRFNSAGRLGGTRADVEAALHKVNTEGARAILGEEEAKARKEARRLEREAAGEEGPAHQQPQAALPPEQQQQQRQRQRQEAAGAPRRAERAAEDAQAHARQARGAEAARTRAAFRVGLLRRLQEAAERRAAAAAAARARERAERGRRSAVRRTRGHARTRDTLSARQ